MAIRNDSMNLTAADIANLKSAALRDVGTGANQIPDMSSFQSGSNGFGNWVRYPDGTLFQWGMYPASGASGGIQFPTPFTQAPAYTLSVTGLPGTQVVATGSGPTMITDVRTYNLSGTILTNGVSWTATGK